MNETVPPLPLRPPSGQALIVFVRPSSYAGGVGGNILDEQGRFLGDTQPESHFAVPVSPGPHLFVIWAENTDALRAQVEAGKTYFVEVSPTLGAFSARMHLIAIKPGRPTWGKREQWIGSTRQYRTDFAAGQTHLATRTLDVAERIRRAQEHMSSYQGEDLDRRTLLPDDGI